MMIEGPDRFSRDCLSTPSIDKRVADRMRQMGICPPGCADELLDGYLRGFLASRGLVGHRAVCLSDVPKLLELLGATQTGSA